MANGVAKARWFRLYLISKNALNPLKENLGGNLSVEISKELEFKMGEASENERDTKVKVEGVDLLEEITQQQYLKRYHKMSDEDIHELTTNMIKNIDSDVSPDKISKLIDDYLNEKKIVSDTFYLVQDESYKIILIVPDKSVNRVIEKIAKNSNETPSVFDLPDGPEFLLWLFSKYWNRSKINGINITNISSVSNMEEQNNHQYTHRADGESERDSLEICFKIMLNKAITSLRLQLNFNEKVGIEIEIQIPDHIKSPKSFRFSIPPIDSITLPDDISQEIYDFGNTEKLVVKKALGIYILYSILLTKLILAYKNEQNSWVGKDKMIFINEIYKFAGEKIQRPENGEE